MRFVSICPDCNEEFTRFEWLDDQGRTGFCHPCAQHCKLCPSNLYMSSCIRSHRHSGNHLTEDGAEFVDDGVSRPYAIPRAQSVWSDVGTIDDTVSSDRIAKDWKPSGNWIVSEEAGPAMVNLRGVANGDKKTVIG